MIKDLTLAEATLSVKPNEHLGLIRLTCKNLPPASAILITLVRTGSFATRADAVQSSLAFGSDMVITPGQYDIWIEPSDGGKSEKVAEKINVIARQNNGY
jgi:hypothetical protein